MRAIAVFFLILLFACPLHAQEKKAELKSKMHEVYQAFKPLQRYLASEERFVDPKNEEEILKLINTLDSSFHSDTVQHGFASGEPGFETTLEVLSDMLSDSRSRFAEGRKQYALWRLRTVSNYCVTCHTRHKVQIDFQDDINLDALEPFERAELLLASRQFDKAAEAFLKVLDQKDLRIRWIEALRKYLVIQTRVHPDPDKAIAALKRVLQSKKLVRGEEREVAQWIESLDRWEREKPQKEATLKKAARLIRTGSRIQDDQIGVQSSVDLLRATAVLHAALDGAKPLQGEERAEALYLLGVAYSRLPTFFVNELPELFLKRAIRQYPGTDIAERSYQLFQTLMFTGFSGSSGLHLPDDVRLEMRELHDIAYGVKTFKPQG